MKKYIMSTLLLAGGVFYQTYSADQPDTSCATLCPTCPQKFLNFCKLCKYKDGILKAQCQDADNPGKYITTSCPIDLNGKRKAFISTLEGQLQCQTLSTGEKQN